MSIEERIRFLMQAAVRAEQEGSDRVARSLRRMAEQARPLEADPAPALPDPSFLCCSE